MVSVWISTVSTVILVILTGIYVRLTHSIAIAGKEPILEIGEYGVLNIMFNIEIKNISEHFAKDVQVKFIEINNKELLFSGPKVLFPSMDTIVRSDNYKCFKEPVFKNIEEGDKIVIYYKSILGKRFKQVWEYKPIEYFLDQQIPAGFKLVDIGKV